MLVTAKCLLMEKNDQNIDQERSETKKNGEPKGAPLIIAIFLFLSLAAGVFFISERHAEKSFIGLPNFADSAFILTDQNGDMRQNADFAGRPIALFFGFTYCFDVCPTTLMALANSLDQLSRDDVKKERLQIQMPQPQ